MCCFTYMYMQTSARNVTKLCIQTATTRLSLMIDEYVSYSCTAGRTLSQVGDQIRNNGEVCQSKPWNNTSVQYR